MEEKEKISEIVATYPSVFVGTAIGGTIFEFICMIVCIVAAPPEQKLLFIVYNNNNFSVYKHCF